MHNYSAMGKKSATLRWTKVHSQVKIDQTMSKNKVALMAYLSGDGHIAVRMKEFHYEMAFYMDDKAVANRIADIFLEEFGIRPKIRHVSTTVQNGSGYYSVRLSNKPICLYLLGLGSYGKLEWRFPKELDISLLKEWTKCYFDCEAHINKSRGHIQVKSVNGSQLRAVNDFLNYLGIHSRIYGPLS